VTRWVLLLVALATLAGCGGGDEPSGAAAPPAAEVKELANVLDLRSDFEAGAGKARAILLFSPT
jgi:hypothetical protein